MKLENPIDLRALKKERIKQGITLYELADQVHLSFEAVKGWESGRRLPTVTNLIRWCNSLGLTLQIHHCTKDGGES